MTAVGSTPVNLGRATEVRVKNLGPGVLFLLVETDASTVSPDTGYPVDPGHSVYFGDVNSVTGGSVRAVSSSTSDVRVLTGAEGSSDAAA